MKDNKKKITPVLIASSVIAIIIAGAGIFFTEAYTGIAGALMAGLKQNFSWLYLWVELFFVLFVVVLAVSPWGKLTLGKEGEKPEYSTVSWFAMLFAAGMGIGLVFWGIAEPLSHYVAPMGGIPSMSPESEAFSIRSSFMHWGLHPWSSYAIIGLGLAYFQFRKGESVLISNMFKPVLGEKNAKGLIGQLVDILTALITVIGVASSFGMGCIQVSAGLHYVYGIPDSQVTWIIIIVLVSAAFMTSAIKGLDKGIKTLSNINMGLCALLVICAFLVGPKLLIVNELFTGLRDYVFYFFQDSIRMVEPNGDVSWIQGWRVYYWAWWISWVPFVGSFIARISKGRSIRQFVVGVTVVPTLVSCIWFAVFGGVAINATAKLSGDAISEIIASPQTALYYVFEQYPLGIVLALIAMLLCVLFYITSADSATFVLAMLTSDGDPDPDNRIKIFWGILIAIVAYALIVTGGVSSIQTLSIIIAFPYVFVMVFVCVNILVALKREVKK